MGRGGGDGDHRLSHRDRRGRRPPPHGSAHGGARRRHRHGHLQPGPGGRPRPRSAQGHGPHRARGRLPAGRRAGRDRRDRPGRDRCAAGLLRAGLGAPVPAPRPQPGHGTARPWLSAHRTRPLSAHGRPCRRRRGDDRRGRPGAAPAPGRHRGRHGSGRCGRGDPRTGHGAHPQAPGLPTGRRRSGDGGRRDRRSPARRVVPGRSPAVSHRRRGRPVRFRGTASADRHTPCPRQRWWVGAVRPCGWGGGRRDGAVAAAVRESPGGGRAGQRVLALGLPRRRAPRTLQAPLGRGGRLADGRRTAGHGSRCAAGRDRTRAGRAATLAGQRLRGRRGGAHGHRFDRIRGPGLDGGGTCRRSVHHPRGAPRPVRLHGGCCRHHRRRLRGDLLQRRHAAPLPRSRGPHRAGRRERGFLRGRSAAPHLAAALRSHPGGALLRVGGAAAGGTAVRRVASLWRRALARAIPRSFGEIDARALEDLEERLITADFGVRASQRFVEAVEEAAREEGAGDGDGLRRVLAGSIRAVFEGDDEGGLAVADTAPTVYLMVGVNGVGKTTTVGKIAHRLAAEGRSVIVAAADTYRAGATRQLERWTQRAGAGFVRGKPGGDPAAVAYDALSAATARGADVVLVDTAGRLHTHKDLMKELAKVERVIRGRHEGAPHETLLVLDATVGQNGLVQAREFSRYVTVTGIVLAKMDSTARGGIVVALREELGIPVRLVGVGEDPQDLEPFDPDDFVQGILGAP
ncbi:MAG: signal recognition particle-docking protein FtsY [Gemmatimonadetes bacterium]|nr:signal recognition particle-docking protein FtsY [Gemmatimonadota bacterium]